MRFRDFREPIWRDARVPSSCRPSPLLRGWLRDDSSLTRRLQGRCTDSFHVQVIDERLGRPRRSEAALLRIPAGRLAWVRQVYLRCGDERWVYARTVIPVKTLCGVNAGLTRLGTRPLGGFLFSHPKVERGPLQTARAAVPGSAGPVFGRRSLFWLRGRPLLVSEFFLESFARELGDE